jgi:hypothetical protein
MQVRKPRQKICVETRALTYQNDGFEFFQASGLLADTPGGMVEHLHSVPARDVKQ